MIPVIAHGLGDAGLLPLPLPLVLVAAGGAVLGLGTGLARRTQAPSRIPSPPLRVPTLARGTEAPDGGIPVPPGNPATATTPTAPPTIARAAIEQQGGWVLPVCVSALVDARTTRLLLAAAGLLGGFAVLALAVFGPVDAEANPATRLVLVVVWAGVIPLSFVAPGAWRALSPLRAATAGIARLSGDPKEQGVRPLPAGLGWWPAVISLAVFTVVEGPLRNELPALLIFLVVYGLVHIGLAAFYGSPWYAHAEAFEVLAAIVGRLSPVSRTGGGRLRIGSPMARLTADAPPGTVPIVGILVGAALADFLFDTPTWGTLTLGQTGAARIAVETAALAGCIGVATVLAAAGAQARPLIPALLPLVTGYLFAHYFAVLLIEGQAALSQLSALLDGRLRTLTTGDLLVRYDLLPGPLAATIQLLGFLLPHLLAVFVGHRLALAHYGARRARAAQAPLLAVLAVSAVAGIALRYAAA